MPVGKRVNLHSLFFHYNLASHLFLSLSSPLIFTTLNVSPSTPGDHFQLPLWHLCVVPEAHSWTHQFCSQSCASTCVPFPLMVQQSYLWPRFKSSGRLWDLPLSSTKRKNVHVHGHTWTHTEMFANSCQFCITRPLESMPSSCSPQHWPNWAPAVSIILWIFTEGLCTRYHERHWGDGQQGKSLARKSLRVERCGWRLSIKQRSHYVASLTIEVRRGRW